MATTINNERSVQGDGNQRLDLKLTAGGVDTTVTYTIPGAPQVWGVCAMKTTGTIGAQGVTYVESTGVLTVQCAANDVVRISVFMD